jgi:hypothetical protein
MLGSMRTRFGTRTGTPRADGEPGKERSRVKELALACMALLVVPGFTTPAQALPICFKWVSFCDGVQVNGAGAGIDNAAWYHWDCASNSSMDAKAGGHFTSNCGTNGGAIARSSAGNGPGAYYFVIDTPLDGTLDMHQGTYPNGTCWIPALAYNLQMGACTALKGANQTHSTIQ